MLKRLHIKNFKNWEDTKPIELAPITLFFGGNSSGKSSIGHFLLMLKQTVASSDQKTVFFTGDENSAVQLGSYRNMVHRHDTKRKIEFSYEWSIDNDPEKSDYLTFEAGIEFVDNSMSVNHFKYDCSGYSSDVRSVSMRKKQNGKNGYKLETEGYQFTRNQGRGWPLPHTIRFYGFPNEVFNYYKDADFLSELNLHHEQLFGSLYYLGPLRTRPQRTYTWSGNEPGQVGYEGKDSIAAILAARHSKRKIGLLRPNPAAKRANRVYFEEVIAEKLRAMGLLKSFTVKEISKGRQEYEVKLRVKGAEDTEVNLPDIGFGVSQVLPVLVQCFYAPPGSIIIIEQPELHLHPGAQAELADVMIDAINAKEKGKPRHIQLIIESHSEHFLRRLQRRIAEGKIPQERVRAYFADAKLTPARLTPLQINETGHILNWPEHFFGDAISDIIAQDEAAIDKKKRTG